MKRHALLAGLLAAALNAAAGCELTPRSLVGSWEASSKSAPFELMSFEVEKGQGVFNSWRHDRPDYVEARWRLSDCRLQVVHADDRKLDVVFLVVQASGQRISLQELQTRRRFSYRKLGD